MKMSVECVRCGDVEQINMATAIKVIIDITERESVFGGFICEACAKKDNDDDDEKAEWRDDDEEI